MDAFAAKQLEKKKALLAKKANEQALDDRPTDEKLSREERMHINSIFGILDPPMNCYAVGKDESAAVWWTAPPPCVQKESAEAKNKSKQVKSIWHQSDDEEPVSLELTGWEILRFRKDKSKPNGEWLYKGCNAYPILPKPQVLILNLTNDYEYRFEVKAVNAKGKSVESVPSNPVMVEAVLPDGWHRFFDKNSHRFYYSNIKFGKSRWTRPEEDPLFLEESILFNFEEREITHLKALFDEDIHHYNELGVNQFVDVLREVGESCGKQWIAKLIKIYTKNGTKVTTWKTFMEIINHIKRSRIKAGAMLSKPIQIATSLYNRVKVFSILDPRRKKMGDWQIEYNSFAEKNYYRNMKTGETSWSIPPAVKYYIPPKLEQKLLRTFTYGQLDEFQQYFSLLDVDSSGDLSEKEIRVLLTALEIEVDDAHFASLIRVVDLNGNGTIEFDEFCMMLYEIYRKDKVSEFWQGIRAPDQSTSAAAADEDASVTEMDRRYDSLIDEKDEDGGNIWKIGFSISKLQEAVKDLRVTAKSRVKESKEAILFQSEEENDDQANNAAGAASQEGANPFSLNLCGSAAAVRVESQGQGQGQSSSPSKKKAKSMDNSDNVSAMSPAVASARVASPSPSPSPQKSLTNRFSQSFSVSVDSSPDASRNGKSKSFDGSFSPQIQSFIRKNNSVSPLVSSPSDDKTRRLSMAVTSVSTKSKKKSGSSFFSSPMSIRGSGTSSKSLSWDNDNGDGENENDEEEKHSKFCMCGCRGK